MSETPVPNSAPQRSWARLSPADKSGSHQKSITLQKAALGINWKLCSVKIRRAATLFINRSGSFSKSSLVAMGINCVLSQARYWLISLGTAFLVSSNSLVGWPSPLGTGGSTRKSPGCQEHTLWQFLGRWLVDAPRPAGPAEHTPLLPPCFPQTDRLGGTFRGRSSDPEDN